MKKIIFSIFILVLATVVGCQKSDIAENKGAQKITVTATIDSAEQTRVALTPDTNGEGKPIVKVAWKDSGEAFRVYGVEEDPIKIYGPSTFSQIDDTNNFSGTDPYQYSWYYFATYPASDLITVQKVSSEAKISYDKSNFTSQNGKLSEERTLMYDEVNTINSETLFDFEHLTTLLMPRFRIRGESQNLPANKIASITFKDMFVPDGTADFNIDCSSHNEGDDIYVYLPETEDGRYGSSDFSFSQLKSTIEIIVSTTDAKTYEGSLTIPNGTILESGNLYTANFWLDPKVETNVITYTTVDNQPITFGQYDLSADLYSSHTFENGIGRITLNDNVASLPSYAITGKNVKTITLPSNITTLENVALGGNEYLTSIDITYITELKDNALSGNPSLSNITMPQNSYTIGIACFAGCSALTQIDLSNATSIGNSAFVSCGSLTTIIIDKDTPPTLVAYNPFDACPSLSNIYVPDDAVETYKTSWAIIPNIDTLVKPISTMQ